MTERLVHAGRVANRSAVVNVMVGAASRAARGLNRDFGEVQNLQVSERGPDAFAAAAVARAGEVLAAELRRARRGFAYLAGGRSGGNGAGQTRDSWLVEALDGADNYRHGLPWFATVIAAREGGTITAAVIYEPLRDELFWAERGRGAYVNNQRLRVSARATLASALVATCITGGDDAESAGLRVAAAGRVAGLRETGAPALDLAAVAAGRFDGFWGAGLSPATAEAGALLVREAGGLVEERGEAAGARRTLLAANARLAAALADMIRASDDAGHA